MVHNEESRMLSQQEEAPDEDLADLCWVCLEGPEAGPLRQPCKCPTLKCHPSCLARWQLQSAGKSEESRCRFCDQNLPDWRPILTPQGIKPCSTPLITVKYNGLEFKFRVPQGAEGHEKFRKAVEKIIGADITSDGYQVTFACARPDAADKNIEFNGMPAFDAAIHCAAIAAAARDSQKQHKRKSWWSGLRHASSSTGSSSSSAESSDDTDATVIEQQRTTSSMMQLVNKWFKKDSRASASATSC